MATDDSDKFVWYVCYGHYMKFSHFERYITEPGRGSGVADTRAPLESRRITLPYQLYFARPQSANGGAPRAFVDPEVTGTTYGRAYLIRWGQFEYLYNVEDLDAGKERTLVDYTSAVNGRVRNRRLTYGRVQRMGFDSNGRPLLLLTAAEKEEKDPSNYADPSDDYLMVIAQGLRETWPDRTDRWVLDYFARAPGIAPPTVHGRSGTELAKAATPGQEHVQERRWARLSVLVRQAAEPRTTVAIVGGGIAGLYCAREIAKRHGFEVTLFEAAPRFGGRIETLTMHQFIAEFGPMRFEKEVEPLFTGLCEELKLDLIKFPKMASDSAAALSASYRYDLQHDELRHTFDAFRGSGPRTDKSAREDGPPPPTPLDLLRLGVVRLFRRPLYSYLNPTVDAEGLNRLANNYDLCADTTAELPTDPDGHQWTADEWALTLYEPKQFTSTSLVDAKKIRRQVQEWIDSLDDSGYDRLRWDATHRVDHHYLRDEGFWNAMSEELSPAALRYIREEGTFYHLFPDNPNAVEWGIFWLRLFRTEARTLWQIDGGSYALVQRVLAELNDYDHVRLRPAQEVLALEPATDPSAIRLTIRDRRDGGEYHSEAHHCILALPLAPLRRLAASFPDSIQEDLHQVFGFPLLKCFLQVSDPWWRKEMPPHAGAGGVPTRELHFQRKESAGGGQDTGLIMVYTDHPATEFWKPLVALPVHDQAEVGPENERLKRALVRHLLIDARRQAHRRLSELLLDTSLDEIFPAPLPDDAAQERGAAVGDFLRSLKLHAGAHAPEVSEWYQRLIGTLPVDVTMDHLERVLDVLRNPGHPAVAKAADEGVRDGAFALLKATPLPDRFPGDSDRRTALYATFARVAVSVQWCKGGKPEDGSPIGGEELLIEEQVAAASAHVQLWGIRDWSRLPVGAGCHAWAVGAHSWEVMARCEAFGLPDRHSAGESRNVHICGEAISDYQGFIEGALRSASRVINVLTARRDQELSPNEELHWTASRPSSVGL